MHREKEARVTCPPLQVQANFVTSLVRLLISPEKTKLLLVLRSLVIIKNKDDDDT